ncbi:threonine ammonia-lyase [Stigmatella aurantiaca]|uniref:Threonine dehydratase n=1 Tax=Stigmatella aurantiaca (strain DW4/3-1) TaxID=378806 RepID=Q095H4_STIAD|nr:threonine ammonia-lyase [Stigmatella aurantiaca]ADO74299.1 Threonine dehydratase [Stigmatella aurantiaca DW4/3-1]EAU67412.1 threonine dehydratase [Stigmatella aurantiaca DW4/3-1]
MVTLQDILAARERIRGAIRPTPCPASDYFTERTGCSAIWFKMENLQRTGAFKERGALNKLLTLTQEERAGGVVAASAGNHAQGLAYHARRLGVKATIVMPERTPLIKVSRTRDDYEARVILKGSNFDEAYAEALRVQEQENLVFVHPFNDPHVIAGQGTIGLELLEQIPFVDMVLVPIGGGGLISGVACALKETNPRIQVIGVQAAAVASMKSSLEMGQVTELPAGATIAEGISVRKPGDLTFPMVRKYVDEIVTVDEEEIANAILVLLEQEKSVVEGAGAVGLAALLNGHVPRAAGRNAGVLLCGGNIDMNVISRIIERGLVKAGRLVRLEVSMPDRPGMLARLTTQIAEQRANVVEIHHNRAFSKTGLGEAMVGLTLETTGRAHIQELMGALSRQGWQVTEEA